MKSIILSVFLIGISILSFSQTQITINPVIDNNSSGYVDSFGVNNSGDLLKIGRPALNFGYVTFDMSQLPNGAIITAATLTFHVDPNSGSVAIGVNNDEAPQGFVTHIGRKTINNTITSDEIDFGAIMSTDAVWDGTPGPKTASFNAEGVQILQNKAATLIGIGLVPPTETSSSTYGRIGGADPSSPTALVAELQITYTQGEPQKPSTDFSVSDNKPFATVEVEFSDNTGNGPITDWLWDFGDGDTSTVQNPRHTYAQEGEYDVKLTATNENGDSTYTRLKLMRVKTLPPAPEAGFTYTVNELSVSFTDTSINSPDKWIWRLGESGAVSAAQNPTWIYSAYGEYEVTLEVSHIGGKDTLVRTITVAPASVSRNELSSVSVYPNPVQEALIIANTSKGSIAIEIYSATGNKLVEIKANDKSTLINTEEYEKGMYFVKIISNNSSKTTSIIKL
jgi:PKD repeat protein